MRILWSLLLLIPLTLQATPTQSTEMSGEKGNVTIQKSDFNKWMYTTTKNLRDAGRVVHTDLGDVQIVVKGKGPAIVVLHGGFGGWDQGELVAGNLNEQGFTTIVLSRPGYLASPIYTDPLQLEETTPERQANLIAALLNQLHISKVVVMGFSAGAPVAYEFGLRYPDRTNAVVLECIGANPNEDGLFYVALGAVLSSETAMVNFVSYLGHRTLAVDSYSMVLKLLPMDSSLKGEALKQRILYVLGNPTQYNFLKNMIIATIPISPRLLGTLNDFMGVDYWTKTYTPPVGYQPPVMLIQAINDSNGFYPTAKSVHADLPNSQLISVKNSGHFIWVGPNTMEWKLRLLGFLRKYGK